MASQYGPNQPVLVKEKMFYILCETVPKIMKNGIV